MYKLTCLAMGLTVYTKEYATLEEAVEVTSAIKLAPDCCFTIADETGKVVELVATQQMLDAIEKIKKQMENGTFNLDQFGSSSKDFFGAAPKSDIPTLDPYDDFSLGTKKIPNKKDMN